MKASLLKLKKESKILFDAYEQVKTFYWGNFLRWYADKQIEHSTVIIQPVRVVNVDRTKVNIQLLVTYADRMFSDYSNLDEIQSDATEILAEFVAILNKSPRWRELITGATSGNIEYFEQKGGDLVAGGAMLVNVSLTTVADLCAVPVDNYNFDDGTEPPTPFVCQDATYTVQYVGGGLIESGTIPSGGSKVINVPLCEDATWELFDTDGFLLDSGSIVSGGSAIITAPDASAVLKNTANTTLSTTSIVSGGSEDIVAPDGTSNINKSSGALIQSVAVVSGGVSNTNVADSVITLQNSDATILSTTNVLATDAATIVAPNGQAVNSDSTFTLSVPSGGTAPIPDSQINVNSVDQGDVVSVKTIDVNITDGTDPVTPDSVSLVGNTLTVAVPSGGVAPVGATLTRSGQTTIYRTGDDSSKSAEGRDVDFFTLASNNPFGNTDRFTDTLGGSAYADNVVIDWSTYNGTTVTGWYKEDFVTIALVTWNTAIDNALALAVSTFVGWKIPNIRELQNIMNYAAGNVFNYAPFNNTSLTVVWSSTTDPNATGNALVRSGSQIIGRGKGSTSYPVRCRTFTVTGTTLT